MRKVYLITLLSFFIFSCEKEKKSGSENYLKATVGKVEGGKFAVTNAAAIKDAWLASGGNESDYDSFEIVQGLTQGDIQQEYYLLLSKNKTGDLKTAALLTLKDNEFYFEEPAEISSYIKITCTGNCADDCKPVLSVSEGARYLVCTPCPDCRKTETEMR